ncbi:uncharacterized protein LOC133296182 [Gastrolobium bilobum]|uniref:uncharacterized protein LOC133296182 n=1 Tax=Gastrolobium bilobum TaxID=150636 RepID=UPI002AAF8871|nr:uncharacterized protein LOC133296182 [Gastrolobium bilobum]
MFKSKKPFSTKEFEHKTLSGSSSFWKGKGKYLKVRTQKDKFKKNTNESSTTTSFPQCDVKVASRQTTAVPAASVPQTIARAYTLNFQQSEKAQNLVKGTIYVDNNDVRVLFDSGASHSFIVGPCAIRLYLPMYELSRPLEVITATGEKCTTSEVCKDVKFQYEGQEYIVDLVDCCSKIIVMSPRNTIESSSPYLSVLQARKVLKRGSFGYILLGGLISDAKSDIVKIPVVQGFMGVFPDEIPHLPPEREIEFSMTYFLVQGFMGVFPDTYH